MLATPDQQISPGGKFPHAETRSLWTKRRHIAAFRATGRLGRQDSNLCISESEFAQLGAGEVEHAHLD